MADMMVKIRNEKSKNDFLDRLGKMSGQNVHLCMQCGYCSGTCPMTESMDILPRMVVRMIQLGLIDQLEKAGMYWVCASCQNCGVVCPRGIDLPRVMEALRLLTLRKNRNYIEPSRLSAEIMNEYPQIALVAAFRKSTS
jgi:heterodisulfide reductase subunit C